MSAFLYAIALGAIPPMSRIGRALVADHIFSGTVVRTTTDGTDQKHYGTDQKHVATVIVSDVKKGSLRPGDEAAIAYRKVLHRQMPGPQGQNGFMRKGVKVRAFCVGGLTNLALLEPNGFYVLGGDGEDGGDDEDWGEHPNDVAGSTWNRRRVISAFVQDTQQNFFLKIAILAVALFGGGRVLGVLRPLLFA